MRRWEERSRGAWWLAAWLVVLAAAVLTPLAGPEPETLTQPRTLLPMGWLADGIRNLVLFTPLGALLWAKGRTRRSALEIGFGFSLAIEILQLAIPGRFPALLDLVFNTLGTGLGVGLASSWPGLSRPSAGRARALSLGAAAASSFVLLSAAWLLQPVFPATPYFGGWTPDLGHFEQYTGRVLEARVGAVPIPVAGPAPDTEALRTALADGEPILVRAVTGPPPSALAPLVTLHDDHHREILLVGLEGDDLLIRELLRAYTFGFENPPRRARGVLGGLSAHALFSVEVVPAGPRRLVTVTGVGNATSQLAWTPGGSWALLTAHPLRGQSKSWIFDFVWSALLVFPAAYWARGRVPCWLGVGAIILLAAAMPLVGAMGAFPLREWIAMLAGAGAGAYCYRRAGDGWRTRFGSDGTARPHARCPV